MAQRVVSLGFPFVRKPGALPAPQDEGQANTDSEPCDIDMSEEFLGTLRAHKVSRRRFLVYCGTLTAALALPPSLTPTVARALAAPGKPRVVWLEFQGCTGCTESFLRSSDPDVGRLILDLVSLDYQETVMAAAGTQAEAALSSAMAEPGYLLVVEGSIPSDVGACTIGGRSATDILTEAARGCAAILAVGTCATFGGIPKARPNPTSAASVGDVIAGKPLVNVSGCPPQTGSAGRCSPTATASTTPANAGRTTTRASSRSRSVTRGTLMAGACTGWAARGRTRSTAARRRDGTPGRAGRFRRAMAVSAVRSRTSGTP